MNLCYKRIDHSIVAATPTGEHALVFGVGKRGFDGVDAGFAWTSVGLVRISNM